MVTSRILVEAEIAGFVASSWLTKYAGMYGWVSCVCVSAGAHYGLQV